MGLIKSYNNYVIQQKHKSINGGIIFERDYSTIGGIGDNFNSGQKKYRQGTFVFSVNDESVVSKLYNNTKWETNGEDVIWTKEDVLNALKNENTINNFINKDIYKLKDFAYYGSCTELIRTSINDIISRFPGELYVPTVNNDGIFVVNLQNEILDEEYPYLVDNPFNIDIYTNESENDNIKFFLLNYDKYQYFDGFKCYDIQKVNLETYEVTCYPYCFCKVEIIPLTNDDDDGQKIIIKGWFNENGDRIYVTNMENLNSYIRPKIEYYNNFINSLDYFQKILLNPYSSPKYSAIFEIIKETTNGYVETYEKFTFPLSYGGYNLDISSENYINYINSLSDVSELLDEVYCNNLYARYTHESIKNFDWTTMLNRENETKDDYIENGEKIKQWINVVGRELDEIKFYIDLIKDDHEFNYNTNNNNILNNNNLIKDLNINGWDVKNIFPFIIKDNNFHQSLLLVCQPYTNKPNDLFNYSSKYPNGYVSGYWDSSCNQSKKEIDNESELDKKGFVRHKIIQHFNDKTYTTTEVNDLFLKNLKLNSRHILQKKGTIEGIEMLLSLFGLKSKRWYESIEKKTQKRLTDDILSGTKPYDYDIVEYVAITGYLAERSNNGDNRLPTSSRLCEFFNKTKQISYSEKEKNNPYVGLPVRYYETPDGDRFLFPYYNNNMEIDGKPYYQMHGGWLHKDYSFNNLEVQNSTGGYTDTKTQIPIVNKITDLVNIPNDKLKDGTIYYVNDVSGNYVCVNGIFYEIEYDGLSKYFSVEVLDNQIEIGTQRFDGYVTMYDSHLTYITYDLNKFSNYQKINIYIDAPNSHIHVETEDNYLTHYSIIFDGITSDIIYGIKEENNETELYSENTEIYSENTEIYFMDDYLQENTLHVHKSVFKDNIVELNGVFEYERLVLNKFNDITPEKQENDNQEYHTNYFILHNQNFSKNVGFLGWDRLTNKTDEYNTVKNFHLNTNANNPHGGNFKYDNGAEYLKYFQQIFKYALSKELFKKSCYDNDEVYYTSLQYINSLGFHNLFKDNGEINLYADNKTHYFCDIMNPQGDVSYFYEVLKIFENSYNFYDKKEYEFLKDDESLDEAYYYGENICLDQIINLKNIDIIFYKNKSENNLHCKYIDDVILHYLTQIIPSNIILNIKYQNYES